MFIYSLRNGPKAGNDPWDARTLEWTIPSPPPAHNFDEMPVVKSLDDFWTTKHPELLHHDEEGSHDEAHGHDDHGHDDHGIHMPAGSWMPMFASAGFAVGAWGLVHSGGMAHIYDAMAPTIEAATKSGMSWDQLVNTAQTVVASKQADAGKILTEATARGILDLSSCYWNIKVAIVGGLLGTLGVFGWSLEPIGGYYIHLKKEGGDHE
jgi:hypothetical protein